MPWNPFAKKPDRGFDEEFAAAVGRAGWKVVKITEVDAVISNGADSRSMNLYNIRPAWNNGSPEDRERGMTHFVRSAMEPQDTGDVTFEDARRRLMPRIGPPMELAENPVGKVWLVQGALEANLVLDSEDSMAYIHESTLKEWGRSVESLLPIALENLRRQSSPDRWEPIGEVDGLTAYNIMEDYTAARALIIKDLVHPWPRHGVILGIPSKIWLFCVRLDSIRAVNAISALASITAGRYQKEGWKLMPQPIWYDGTQWEIVNAWVDGGGLHIAPSPRLTEALNQLAGAGA